MKTWIQNRRSFYTAVSIFMILMVLNVRYPHEYPLGEEVFNYFHLPITLQHGLRLLGIISIILLVIGSVLLHVSLKTYKGRITLLIIAVTLTFPSLAANWFEKVFATGIYAISYEKTESECQFKRITDTRFNAKCELLFVNHNNQKTTFEVKFVENDFNEGLFLALNEKGPYNVILEGKESKRMVIEKEVEVNDNESIVSSFNFINLKIMNDSQFRNFHSYTN